MAVPSGNSDEAGQLVPVGVDKRRGSGATAGRPGVQRPADRAVASRPEHDADRVLRTEQSARIRAERILRATVRTPTGRRTSGACAAVPRRCTCETDPRNAALAKTRRPRGRSDSGECEVVDRKHGTGPPDCAMYHRAADPVCPPVEVLDGTARPRDHPGPRGDGRSGLEAELERDPGLLMCARPRSWPRCLRPRFRRTSPGRDRGGPDQSGGPLSRTAITTPRPREGGLDAGHRRRRLGDASLARSG